MKFYLTTPIYYVNDKPHIGHAYTTFAADALARYHRLRGEEVKFVTGTDENSQKNVQAMEQAGENDLTAYLDRLAGLWRQTWEDLRISFDDFIRTTEERHLTGVNRFWQAVEKSGDIYSGVYEGFYCAGCEGFKTESDLVDGHCPLHPKKALQRIKEKNYFFRLSAYREQLLALYDQENFILPEARRHEIRNYVADHLTDISISREAKTLSVGIPVPGDESQRIYVWFDALINYLTAAGYGVNEKAFKKWWPADLHLVGKDIIKFHCALWPAMIMSAAKSDALLRGRDGEPLLPQRVFAHGFFTLDGTKISKSLGNAIDPLAPVGVYGLDAVRYFLLREIPFGEDGDFSRERLHGRYVSDLGNTFGNLVNRAIAMSRKYFDNKAPSLDVKDAAGALAGTSWGGATSLRELTQAVEKFLADNRSDLALEAVWNGVGEGARSGLLQANKYIEETQPFKLVKTEPDKVGQILYAMLEACRLYAWLTCPMMPVTAEKIFSQLGLDPKKELAKGWTAGVVWGGLPPGIPLGEPQPLFPRLEKM